jgi:hypothetical protein
MGNKSKFVAGGGFKSSSPRLLNYHHSNLKFRLMQMFSTMSLNVGYVGSGAENYALT